MDFYKRPDGVAPMDSGFRAHGGHFSPWKPQSPSKVGQTKGDNMASNFMVVDGRVLPRSEYDALEKDRKKKISPHCVVDCQGNIAPRIYCYTNEHSYVHCVLPNWETATVDEKQEAVYQAGIKQRAAWLKSALLAMRSAGEQKHAEEIFKAYMY